MQKKESANAIAVLKSDHKKVKGLFDQFEKAKESRVKKKVAEQAIDELKVHAAIEEEIFYPRVREELDEEELELMNEATEEHHVAKVLIAELDQLKMSEEVYEAKFIVLAENVRHHIKEEEGEMFPEVKKLDLDLDELGTEMLQRKKELMSEGVPPTSEESMVKAGGKELAAAE